MRSARADVEPAGDGEFDSLDFIRALHLSPHASFAGAGEIDWGRAPPFLPQRLGAALFPLPGAQPPWQACSGTDEAFGRLGAWLASSLMCHRTGFDPDSGAMPAARRAIASGGAAYPADLYLRFGADWAALSPLLPRYAWLYLPHRHALAAHAETGPAATGDAIEATLVTVLSRTAFKYREFAYRLSAVDSGVALGRLIAAARAFGAEVDACPAEGDEVLGLLGPEEQAAARLVCRLNVPIAPGPKQPVQPVSLRVEAGRPSRLSAISAGQPAVFAELESAGRTGWPQPQPQPQPLQPAGPAPALGWIPMPPAPAPEPEAFAARVHARRSEAPGFSGAPVPLAALAHCLQSAGQALSGLAAFAADASIRVGCAVVAVEGLEPLTGVFDADGGGIAITRRGSAADRLNRAMLLHAFDMRQCSFVLHVLADIETPCLGAGPRGYRRSQVAVGAMLDSATLAAVGAGLSAHAFLGFSAPQVGPLYGLEPEGKVQPVAQLCVGRGRAGRHWETAIVG